MNNWCIAIAIAMCLGIFSGTIDKKWNAVFSEKYKKIKTEYGED